MYQREHSAGGKPDVFEPEPDIKQHTDRSDGHGDNRVLPHLRAYRGADILCGDLFCHAKVFLHVCLERFTLFKVQGLCLEYDLVSPFYCLDLNVHIPCDVFQLRYHMTVNLIQRVFFIKCDCGCSTARKIKAVIHGADTARLIDPHSHESADTQKGRGNKEHFSLSKEVDRLSRHLDPAVHFRIPDSQRIEREDDHPRHYQSCEHGYHDTQRERLCKAFHRTASAEPEHCRRDQSRDISVQDR